MADRSRSVARVTAPFSWMVLAAVVIGAALGAMACAAGLADGSGHRAHAQGPDPRLAPFTASQAGHVAAASGAAGEDASPRSAAPGNDTRSGSAGTWIESHPGMACVVTVDLDVDETATPVMARWIDSPRATPLAEGVVDLDPPIPRRS